MAFDLSAAGNILKTRYLGPIREQLNQSTILLSRIAREDNAINVSGKQFSVPLHTGRNNSAGSGRPDGGSTGRNALPTAGQQGYDIAVIPNTYQYGRIQITGPTIAATKDNAGAFVQAVESEIEGLTQDFKKSFNRQLHSDGIDALGYWTAADNDVTGAGVDLDDGRGNGFTFVQAGMLCDVLDVSALPTITYLNATGAGITISSVGAVSGTPQTQTQNVVGAANDGLAGTADGDALVLYGTGGNQLMGIAGIIDDANPTLLGAAGLHGLPVATKPFWKAQVVRGDVAGTNQPLTLDRMQKPLDLIAQNSDFDENAVKFLLCSYGVRAKYVAELLKDKRHVNTMELDGGFKAVDFNGIPLVPDRDSRKNRIYYVAPVSMKIFRTSDFDWMEKDGAVLSRVQNGDAYEATMFHYGNLGVVARNANGLLDDIEE